MYQAGIFIILDPGYYRFTVECYHNDYNDFSKYAYMEVQVNSTRVMLTYCKWAQTGNSNGIFYLEAFDTVFVKKGGQRLNVGAFLNNFMIEKL